MEFSFSCRVGELVTRDGKKGKYHKVSLQTFGFEHEFFVPDSLIPDLLIGKEQTFVFKVVKSGKYGLDLQLKGLKAC